MPNTFFPFAQNVRTYENGQLGPRPPLGDPIFQLPSDKPVVSLARMQDRVNPAGPAYVIADNAGNVFASSETIGRISLLALEGFSGKRVSLVAYRPSQSVDSWMYIGDSARMGKVKGDGTGRNMGIEEPQVPVIAALSSSPQSDLLAYFASILNWQPMGTGTFTGGGSLFRTNGASIDSILFDYGTQGDASVVVQSPGANIAVNCSLEINKNPNDLAFVEAFMTAPSTTTVNQIVYDSGTTGMATVTLNGTPTVVVNDVYVIGAEHVRVQAVWGSVSQKIIRVFTKVNHVGGEVCTGLNSYRMYFPQGAAIGDALREPYIELAIVDDAPPTNGMYSLTTASGTMTGGRAVQATDILHFLGQIDTPGNITNVIVTFNIDPDIIDFETNALQWTIPASAFGAGGTWIDASITVSALTRLGTDTSLDLSTGITGIQIVVTDTGVPVTLLISDIVIVGQYGPSVSGGEGNIYYCCKWRDTDTGAVSNPSPPLRAGLMPDADGQAVVIVPPVSTDSQAKVADIYRFGASLLNYTYVGTGIPGEPLLDVFDDLTIAGNPLMAFDDFQPFPSIDTPHNGVVNVDGFNVNLVSGDEFVTNWGAGTEITINGIVYTLYNRPGSVDELTILQDAGTQGNVPYSIPRPVLLGQPMPALWGPTDNTGFNFGCGDTLRQGTLYFTKGNQPDSAPDTNQIEVTGPAEPLMNGVLLAGLGMVFSTERSWWIYPNFGNVVSTLTGVQGNPFYLIEAITNRGLYARFGICTDGGGVVYFVAKDGIYKSAGGKAVCLTDLVYSLFPHESSEQLPIAINGVTVQPPDMAADFVLDDAIELTFSEERVYFDYQDAAGNPWTLVLDTRTGLWGVDTTTPVVTAHCPQIGNAEGTAVGCADGSIRAFEGDGDEVFASSIQSIMTESEAPGWQHAGEFNFNYTSTVPLTVTITAAPGGISPLPVIMPPALLQTKAFSPVPPNKFKLAQYMISGNGTWRVWTQGFEIKQGAWERSEPYKIVDPFNVFGKIEEKSA